MENAILAETPVPRVTAVDFDALVCAHARLVLNVAYSVLQNAEDAEDVAQETFFRAYRSGEVEKVERIRAWLARIAWRLALNRLRQRSGRLRRDAFEDVIGQMPAAGKSAEEILLSKEREILLAQLLRKLPRELRETFALLTVDGMTSAEAAEVLDISESSVRDRWARARKLLKEKLAALVGGAYGS